MSKPWQNKSGLNDPTAYAGEREISREEQRVADLIGCIKYIARMAGFEVINRIEFRNLKSHRTYK